MDDKGIGNWRFIALLDTEGTVTVSTDHTSGSSLESATQNAEPQGFATPNYAESLDKVEAAVEQCAHLPADAPGHSFGQTSAEATIGSDADAIEFRVIRVGAPVRRLRLTGNRYTFGSAEGCSIRLSDSALRPMHAVLIRDTLRVLVRAYSVPIEINGTRTTEASLQVGDTLRLGAYQFELLTVPKTQGTEIEGTAQFDTSFSSDPFSPTSFPSGPRSIFDMPTGSFDPVRSSDSKRPMDSSGTGTEPSSTFQAAHRELPPAEDVIWRERLRREVEQWRERQLECDRRENRCDDRESDLRSRESELWSRAENLYRREARVQSQEASTFQLYDEFTQRQHELIKLREAAQSRQEEFNRREAEFRGQEFEYRRRLEEATRQLQQSNQQAETATQAVQRMREQFESLNGQIEELSAQQQQIESREQRQQDEHKRLRLELEDARDQAIDAQTESEARRCGAEARVAEMAAQIESLKSAQGMDLQQQQAQLEESERVAQQLRVELEDARDQIVNAQAESEARRCEAEARVVEMTAQIESLKSAQDVEMREQQTLLQESERVAQQLHDQVAELQKSVSQASEESSRLRNDYEGACESVRQLESLVAQSNERGDQDRGSWAAEADELRSAVDQLSIELARAHGELSDLREANAAMSARLDDVQRERDDALQDVQSRPTSDELQSLRTELDVAHDQLSQMKREYDETLARLSEVEAARDREPDSETESEQGSASTTPAVATGAAAAGLNEPFADDHQHADDDEVWPTYHSSSSDSVSDSLESQSESPAAESDENSDESSPDIAQEESLCADAAAISESTEATLSPDSGDSPEPESVWGSDRDDSELPEHTAAWGGASDLDVDRELTSDVDSGELDSPWSVADPESADVEAADSVEGAELDASSTDQESAASPWGQSASSDWDDSQVDESPWRSDASAGESADDDRESAQSWKPDSETAWPEPESPEVQLNHESESTAESVWDSDSESLSEAPSPEMTSVWDEAGQEIAQGDADEGEADPWSQAQDATEVDDPVQDKSSIIDGSLASMLIKDLENDSLDDAGATDGTYLMSDEPASSWDKHAEQSGWDREYAEETRASDWSNDPEGFRVESIEESQYESLAGVDDAYDESQQDEEAGYTAEYDPSASYDEPQAESEPEQLDSATPSNDDAEDDDSIEAYMNRLLNRGQSGGGSKTSDPETVSLSTSHSSLGPESLADREIDSEHNQAEREPIDPDAPLVPRSQAPERNSGLTAMRELANASARSAISRSVRIQTRDTQIKGAINFACAAGAAACGIACLIFLPGFVRYVAVAMTALVAVIYIMQGMQEFSAASRRLKAIELGLVNPEDEVANENETESGPKTELAESAVRDE